MNTHVLFHAPGRSFGGRRSLAFSVFAALAMGLQFAAHVYSSEPAPLLLESFENGLATPWGTGQYAAGRPAWWNHGDCKSTATVDREHPRLGNASLRITNSTSRAPNVYGTTQMPLAIQAGQRYRISVWARSDGLASAGAINIALDKAWKVRPIRLPAGAFDWTLFQGEFSLPTNTADVRIISEDKGRAWLDGLTIVPLTEDARVVQQAPLESIGDAAALFRQVALRDYETAVREFTTDDARRKFQQFDENVWTTVPPEVGWSYFVNVANVTLASDKSDCPLVAYYNCWCDVALITAWKALPEGPKIVDAELVMGDWVRTGGKFPTRPVPQWLRGDFYRPAALGLSSAETVAAIQTTFAAADGATWRNMLPGLRDEKVLVDLNYTGVALLLAEGVNRIGAFASTTDGEDARLPALRKDVAKTLQLGASGSIRQVLDAAGSISPDVRAALESQPPQSFKTLAVASAVLQPDECYVFLAPAFNSSFCVALVYGGDSERLSLRRIELVCYEAIYQRYINYNSR